MQQRKKRPAGGAAKSALASVRSVSAKAALHPRNRHQGRYDLPRLVAAHAGLARFVVKNAYGDDSIDFTNPAAVKALNRAILQADYAIADWDIPAAYLCPPIPGRVDYLHYLGDLLAGDHGGEIPRGPAVRLLDVGVGANCIYPLLGQREYGWHFVGSDVDAAALSAAQRILSANGDLAAAVELRQQKAPEAIFQGIWPAGEAFVATLCNPPFHASQAEAEAGSARKWRQLGKDALSQGGVAPRLNFGGQGGELWCPGGELAFIRRMIDESRYFAQRCLWFTTLVSKESNLPAIHAAVRAAGAVDCRTVDMAQGQKKSRFVAWSFLGARQRQAFFSTGRASA